MRGLEATYDVALFVRANGGTELKPLGRRLYERTAALRDLSDRTVLFRTNDSLTQRTVNDRLSRLGLSLQPLMTLEAREAIYEACAQGLGVGFMFDAASTRADCVARVRIAELSESYPEHVFCLSAVSRLRTMRAFFDLAMRMRP